MIAHALDHFTPRAYPRTRLLSAAAVWSCAGLFLCLKGVYLSFDHPMEIILSAILTGLCVGMLKSKSIFDSVAKKTITHIEAQPNRACLGGYFSVRNWALIFVMALFGSALGALPLHPSLKTGIYVMAGSGLGYSSRLLWKAWRNSPAGGLQNS